MLASPCLKTAFACNTAEHGIPWRRGYLFHGPPGSGKTSLVTALAGRLHKSISVVDLSSPYLNDGVRNKPSYPRTVDTSSDMLNYADAERPALTRLASASA